MPDIILASQSPRRKQLLEQAGYTFEVKAADVDETNPEGMPGAEVPEFLARKKAAVIAADAAGKIIIAADTVVLLDNEILGKPADREAACSMLRKLSGRPHLVVSGVCIRRDAAIESFSVHTKVYFRPLSEDQIKFYVDHYHPMDKAGSYAIQEWIGLVGIEKIDGDFYNVMGLPVNRVHAALQSLL